MLTGGDFNGTVFYNDVWEYSFATGLWVELTLGPGTATPPARSGASCVLSDLNVYVCALDDACCGDGVFYLPPGSRFVKGNRFGARSLHPGTALAGATRPAITTMFGSSNSPRLGRKFSSCLPTVRRVALCWCVS